MRLSHTGSSALVVGVVILAGNLNPAAQAIQAPRPRSGAQRPTPAQREARFFGQIEKGLGKKLTSTQKQQLRQAFKERGAGHKAVETKFEGRVAKTLGMTPDQLRAKARQMRAVR